MPTGMYANFAAEGDRVTEVRCRCGSVWVTPGKVAEWTCPHCRGKSIGPTVALGPGGIPPAGSPDPD